MSYQLCQRYPDLMRARIRSEQERWLPEGYETGSHFAPRHKPWDQRLCLAPDADLFRAIRAGALEMVTDRIDTFTETGLRLASGTDVPADVIVTATGLDLLVFGGIDLVVDGEPVEVAKRLTYKAMMLSGVPNFTPGYFRRGGARFPSQGDRAPWRLRLDYLRDLPAFRYSRIDDGTLRFAGTDAKSPEPPEVRR